MTRAAVASLLLFVLYSGKFMKERPDVARACMAAYGKALVLVFITEVEATKAGLGFLRWESFQLLETRDVFAGVVTFGLLGVATTWLLQWAQRVACPWARR